MSLLIEQSNNSLFGVCDALNHDFHSLFSVLIQDFKINTEIIEMLSKRSVTVSDDELYSVFVTERIDKFLSGETLFSKDNHIVVFQELQTVF